MSGASPVRLRVPDGGPGPPAAPRGHPGSPIVRSVVTERAKMRRTSGMGAFCKPSRKRPLRRAYLRIHTLIVVSAAESGGGHHTPPVILGDRAGWSTRGTDGSFRA